MENAYDVLGKNHCMSNLLGKNQVWNFMNAMIFNYVKSVPINKRLKGNTFDPWSMQGLGVLTSHVVENLH